MDCSMPGFPVLHQLLELAQTHVHRVGDTIQLSHPLSSPYPPALSLSHIRVFSNESVPHIRWPQYWSYSFSVSPSSEYSGMISFRIDWFALLEVQGILRVFSNTTVQKHQFFDAQHSLWSNFHIHPYMTTGKTITLTRWPFVDKVMSLLFNTLSRFVIAFLPWSKHLLISWQQSPSTVILEPTKIKTVTVSIVSPSICHEVIGRVLMILVFWMLNLKPAFHFPLSLSSRGSLVLFLPQGWCHLHIWGYGYFSLQSWFQLTLHPMGWMYFSWCTLHIN